MNFKYINLISKNIVKPDFLYDWQYKIKFEYYFDIEKNLKLNLYLPEGVKLIQVLKFIHWINYKNKNSKFEFNIINWDDENELDFLNSKFYLTIMLNRFKNNENSDFYDMIEKSLYTRVDYSKLIKNILFEQYF